MISKTTNMSAARHETADACSASGPATGPGAAGWPCLAATPTFAIMALLTGVLGPHHMLCSAMHDASPLSGMTPMYLLMSVFHSAPWLKLIFGRQNGPGRAATAPSGATLHLHSLDVLTERSGRRILR